jgi:hypothetical protein
MNVSAESATGLRVSTKPYPLFIGGYYTTTPDITLALTANDINYLYVKKTDPNRDSTEVFVSTDLLPIGFSQQLIAKLTTDNDKVIDSDYIPITSGSGTYIINGVAYATSTTNLTTGTALTFDGTDLTCDGNIISTGFIQPSNGTGSNTGIIFPSNPGGGSGDVAKIQYYAITGENTELLISVRNDGDDNIKLSASGQVIVDNVNDSSSSTTGALIVSGGVGVAKNLTAGGNITAYSDAKLKKNIKVIDRALDKVNQLHGYTFDRIDIEGARQTGVLAQEVLQVLPEAVTESTDGIYSVAYGNMVGLLIESVKELTQQVAQLQAQLQVIKK